VEKKYHVTGLFSLEVDAEDALGAREKAERILWTSGIEGQVIQVEEMSTVDRIQTRP
jgi:hypothetical protein